MNSNSALKMHAANKVDKNIQTIAALFPNTITETIRDGKTEIAIDFDALKQELSTTIVEGNEERYQFTWPDKKKSVLLANAPNYKTLRPCREESVNFDTTENLYIEGDNLDVLKLLQETYLGKVKMIYIDPPYNTGKDFVYADNFAQSIDEYMDLTDQYDEEGNRLFTNSETNGRYHTDWLNMIYPRLRLAKDLLKDDGVIFISIDDNEVENLKKICNEVFGAWNFVATLIWDKNHSAQAGIYKVYHEYVVVYAKNIEQLDTPQSLNNDVFEAGAMKKASGRHSMQEFRFPKGTRFDAPSGIELCGEWGDLERVILKKGRMISENGKLKEDVVIEAAFTQVNQMQQFFYGDRETLVDSRGQKIIDFYFTSTGKVKVVKKRGVETPQTTLKFGSQGPISIELASLFETEDAPFDSPKSVNMIADFIARFSGDEDIILDFFSGSATTAHAVMYVNSQRANSNRKFIMAQIQEDLDISLKKATKDGVKTLQTAISYLDKKELPHLLTEIGKERIRRAGEKIKNEKGLSVQNLDIGFRVLKVDSTNMKDVYYYPQDVEQQQLDMFTSNIKEDRTPEDLLFQVMLDLGVFLSNKIEVETIDRKKVFVVEQGGLPYLIACFDEKVTSEVVTAIAKRKPYYAVFRDSSMENDSLMTSFEQIFEAYSPSTTRKVL